MFGRTAADARRTGADASPSGSFVAAVKKGESLEHFHLFNRPASTPIADFPTLDLHSDIGLFIIMTAAEYISQSNGARQSPEQGKPESGFWLQLPNGEVVQPKIPDGSLLVMNGEGCNKWVRRGSVQLQVPTHEVVIPEMQGLVRAWFGRMYLPPHDAVLQEAETDLTFGEYRQQTVSASAEGQSHMASSVGCGRGRQILAVQGSCQAGYAYCWHSCMSLANLSCTIDQAICANPANPTITWPDNFTTNGSVGHCPTCKLLCPTYPPPPYPPTLARAPPPAPPPSPSAALRTDGWAAMWILGAIFALRCLFQL